jgi:hypothetical protein
MTTLTILILAAGMARADEDSAKSETKQRSVGTDNIWGGYGLFGGMFSFTALNTQLHDLKSDFTAFRNAQFMNGGGGLAKIGPVTIGGYGFGGSQAVRSESLGMKLTAEYGGGLFEAGWLPLDTRYFKLGPALGIGGGGFSLIGAPTSESDIGFDSLLVKGVHNWRISGGGFMLAPALNIIIPVKWVALALKVGYLWIPGDGNWSFEDGPDVVPPPGLNSSGPFASVQLMLGSSDDGHKTQVKVKAESGSGDENKKGEEEPGQ